MTFDWPGDDSIETCACGNAPKGECTVDDGCGDGVPWLNRGYKVVQVIEFEDLEDCYKEGE
jgi:hypothetical protein